MHCAPGNIQGILYDLFQLFIRHEVKLLSYELDEWVHKITCVVSFSKLGRKIEKQFGRKFHSTFNIIIY